jgi:hypothetical protein
VGGDSTWPLQLPLGVPRAHSWETCQPGTVGCWSWPWQTCHLKVTAAVHRFFILSFSKYRYSSSSTAPLEWRWFSRMCFSKTFCHFQPLTFGIRQLQMDNRTPLSSICGNRRFSCTSRECFQTLPSNCVRNCS